MSTSDPPARTTKSTNVNAFSLSLDLAGPEHDVGPGATTILSAAGAGTHLGGAET